ncbi:F-box domain-containing protein [Fusarium keratoplasticum]|uniref:F-box domain-containing protein n=1 Tax=Fusarium keratoplasticum TaxID=1328300 RepID=A0ACC0R9I2_9HYPO|nr:F-box domain-containing protein [Fusarium keratoplasticum]KAI8679458.1 F-box domain-containing protein [Fusarium keratoplasticum]KAI8685552.1 F-box domain-containing protein [Fusarium keratoplasticum]
MENQQLTPEPSPHILQLPSRALDFTLSDNLPPLPSDWDFLPRPSTTPFPFLDRLPPELFHIIISQLDLASLHALRRTNRRAAELLYSHSEYNTLITHAWDAVRGALCINTAKIITCKQLHEKLCTEKCDGCGDFGGYLYLLTCKRVCFVCFSERKRYFPVPPSLACRKYWISSEVVDTLPHMKVMPGVYSPARVASVESVFVDSESALNAGLEIHGSSDVMTETVIEKEMERINEYSRRRYEAAFSEEDPKPFVEPPEVFLSRCDERVNNPHRFLAIVPAPWFNKAKQLTEQGFHCIGCEDLEKMPFHHRRRFTATSFEEHLEECGEINQGKHVKFGSENAQDEDQGEDQGEDPDDEDPRMRNLGQLEMMALFRLWF